jgi:CDP-diacylglycerol--serine O-phosphatidyltransferase
MQAAAKKCIKNAATHELLHKFVFQKTTPMRIKAHVPNTITLFNLFCGCIAAVMAFHAKYELAFLFVAGGIFLDFFDGFFARRWNVAGPLGLQLDSLADMITSGFVPGLIMYQLMVDTSTSPQDSYTQLFPYLGFIITMGSCYRLANFNIDTRQTDSFIGLPTPANALFILSLPLVIANSDSVLALELNNRWVLLTITLLSAWMLNAEIPLFSLKIKKTDFRSNALQYIFLAISVLLLIMLQYLGIPLIIIIYILLSIINNKRKGK